MIINYTLSGSISVPEGSTLTDTKTGVILPSGEILKLWEAWEQHATADDDNPRDRSWSEMAELGCHYDGDMARFELTE